MKINLVTVDSGWILTKIAERLRDNAPAGVEYTISHKPLPGFKHYYYCDIQNCYHGYKNIFPGATHIGYITHAHEDSKEWLEGMFAQQGVWSLDGIKSMCIRYTDMCKEIGWEKPIDTFVPPADHEGFSIPKIKLLIANRGGYPGYGHDFMLNLPDEITQEEKDEGKFDILTKFHFTFLGNGWEPVAEKYMKSGIEAVHWRDDPLKYPESYEHEYHEADYLLIPIMWAAGPMCAMEAHLCGLPIIGSEVGLIGNEIEPEYLYEPGNKGQLRGILNKIYLDRLSRRINVIEGLGGWKQYSKNVTDFIRRCRNE